MIESADGSRTSTGPHLPLPAGRPIRRGVGVIPPGPEETPAALAAVNVTVCSSLTAQHRRSRNGTDTS